MFRSFAVVLATLCLMSSGMARESASSGLEAWYVDSLIKVFPGDARGTHSMSNPEFMAARNQHLSVQLAVRSDRPLPSLSVVVKPLKGGVFRRIKSVEVHRVGYVEVRSHTPDSPPDELVGVAPGLFPDPLEDFPFDLEAERTTPIWVTIHVPADAKPGVYKGSIVVRSGKHVVARNPFRLQVVSASVPQVMSLKYTNWFTLDDKTSRQFYGVAAFSPEWWTLVANVARVLAAHRQNVIITPLRMLIQPRVEGGKLAYDFTNFDRWVETFRKAGAIGYIEGSHLVDRAGGYDEPLIVPTIQIVDGKPQAMPLPPDDPRVEAYLSEFLASLNAHLKDRGWDKIYFQHVLDEAHGKEPPYYAKFAALVHRQMPGIPTLDAVDATKMPKEIQTNCDVWVPQLGRFDDQMTLLNQRLASGHPVWYYTCLFPQKRYINRLLDLPLVKARLLPWLDFRYGFTGFLHWGGNYWTPDPMKDAQPVIENNTEVLPPGDAFIVYPDREHLSFRSSIRFEEMLSGIEDYEMLMALKARDPAVADQIAASAISSFTEYVRDVAAFRGMEQKLLEALSSSPDARGGK
jgi:Glycoside hydrolase 123, catalytic domain/Glycoside hydrolase 123 N-terminal domain